jgi:hypothetical protein
VTDARSHQVGLEIPAELYGEFRGLLSDEAIRGSVRDAMTDLRGSTSREALPEMAVRLAGAARRAGYLASSSLTSCARAEAAV